MHKFSIRLVALIATLLFVGRETQAALTFEFGQSAYQVAAGGTVNVDIFLAATGTDRNFLLSTSAGRIFALGVRINNDQTVNGSRVLSTADILVNTATFDDPLVTPVREVGTGFARTAAFTNDPDGVSLPDTNPLRVRLATLRYTGGAVGVTTTLSFADFDNTTNIAASDGLGGAITLDGNVNFANTATITAVPEPSSIVLVLGGLGMAGCRRLRRRNQG